MLTAEQNDELTDIAPDTPMGELLRRYWYPVSYTHLTLPTIYSV